MSCIEISPANRSLIVGELQTVRSLISDVASIGRWDGYLSRGYEKTYNLQFQGGWYSVNEPADSASPGKLLAAVNKLVELKSFIQSVSEPCTNSLGLRYATAGISSSIASIEYMVQSIEPIISLKHTSTASLNSQTVTVDYCFWDKDFKCNGESYTDANLFKQVAVFFTSVLGGIWSSISSAMQGIEVTQTTIIINDFVGELKYQQALLSSFEDRINSLIAYFNSGVEIVEQEQKESDCEELIEALKKLADNIDYSELIKLLEEIKEMLDPDLAGQIRIEGCEPPDDQNSSLLENWITGILGAVIARVVTATIPGPIDDLLLAPLIAALSDAIAAEVIALFKDIFGERYAEERIYAWSGRGLVGLSAQINALADQTAYLQEQLCQEISEAVAEQSGSERCEPVLVVASSIREDLKLTSQLQIRWIPEGAVYDAKTPTRLLHLPNPRPDLDWCRDFEELRWRAGGGIVARVKWATDVGTWGYFQDAEAAQEFFAAIVPLSASEPKGPWPRLTINHAGRPIKQRTWQPLRAVVALFDNDGQQIGLRCYQRPREGC